MQEKSKIELTIYKSSAIYFFMLIGFLIQSLIFYGLIYFGGADWGASFMIYTMFFALFLLFTSIPAKKVKSEIAALLGKMYAGDPSDNANLLEKNGNNYLAGKYWKYALLGGLVAGANFSWLIVVFYWVVSRGLK